VTPSSGAHPVPEPVADADGLSPPGGGHREESSAANPGLEAAYRAEAARLARFVRRRLPGREDAEDMVHDAFVRLAASGPRDLKNPPAFLQRIVRNLLIDRSRRRAARPLHLPATPDTDLPVLPDQSYAIEADDVKRQYRRAVDALPPRTRQVFLLHRVEELSYRDIARQLEISVRTVEWHVAQALLHIDKAIER